QPLTEAEITRLKTENDQAVVVIDGQSVQIEQAITLVGSYDTPGYAMDVQVVGNYAYVADYYSGLQIIDISNPATPTLKGNYDTSGYAWDVQIAGNYAYVADYYPGLQIIDISNPATPTLKGNYHTSGYAAGVQIVGNYAYVADGYLGLQIIDISNPATPTPKGNYHTSGYAAGVQIAGNYAYVADGYLGLQIIDISNPATPTLKGNYDTSDYAWDVQIVGNYAYVADYYSGLQIIDISNPATPTLKGNYHTSGYAVGVQIVGNYAYVADGYLGLQIIDISNPATPTLKGNYDTSGWSYGVQVVGNYAYVADGDGVQILDVSDFTNPSTSTVTLAVSPSSVTEDGTTNLVYTFTRSGVTTNALTVNYTVGGTATNGTDYTSIPTSVTFAANSETATVIVDPTADTTVESDETVALTLATGTGYTVGTPNAATGTITNVTLPSITLAISPSSVTEDGTSSLIYIFIRTGDTTNPLTVNYSIGGTATNGTDYTLLPTTVIFEANSAIATVTVDPTADTIVESDETVILTLAAGTGYTVGTPNAATGTITNDDTSVTSQLSINDITVVEGKDNNAILTVTVDNPNPQPITFNYTTAPINATANVDYTSKTGTITIAPNTSTATISIPILNDNLNEPDEVFTVTLSNPVNATINPDEAIGQVIITDTLQSAITRTLPNNVENLRLIGTNNINGTGNAGNNKITGNSGINQINGRAGIDTLTGGLGADTFIFQFGQSTISTSDRITDFAINSDKIDLLTQAGNAMNAPSSFSRAANSTVTTLQNLVNQVFTDANGAITGNQGLGVNSAALVQVTSGAIAGTYLIINDSTAGFQSSNDLLINITGFTGTLPALGNIPVGNFFV
ncbi:MAG: hypothetical protein GPJ11_11905, partial [Microcystis aeruginosa L211-101]|nr:hypothetical protein [Microcystis aeruginosa L211-11]NCR31597.1 hypothetical protein [Microcystis aeruginosa L211-101]